MLTTESDIKINSLLKFAAVALWENKDTWGYS